jgi:hypothetical protein
MVVVFQNVWSSANSLCSEGGGDSITMPNSETQRFQSAVICRPDVLDMSVSGA